MLTSMAACGQVKTADQVAGNDGGGVVSRQQMPY